MALSVYASARAGTTRFSVTKSVMRRTIDVRTSKGKVMSKYQKKEGESSGKPSKLKM